MLDQLGWNASRGMPTVRTDQVQPLAGSSRRRICSVDSSRTWQAGVDPALQDQLLGAVPSLRAFAYSLTNSWDRTDDLVQDTLTRA